MARPNDVSFADHIVMGAVIEESHGKTKMAITSEYYQQTLTQIGRAGFGGTCAGTTLMKFVILARYHPHLKSLNRV